MSSVSSTMKVSIRFLEVVKYLFDVKTDSSGFNITLQNRFSVGAISLWWHFNPDFCLFHLRFFKMVLRTLHWISSRVSDVPKLLSYSLFCADDWCVVFDFKKYFYDVNNMRLTKWNFMNYAFTVSRQTCFCLLNSMFCNFHKSVSMHWCMKTCILT